MAKWSTAPGHSEGLYTLAARTLSPGFYLLISLESRARGHLHTIFRFLLVVEERSDIIVRQVRFSLQVAYGKYGRVPFSQKLQDSANGIDLSLLRGNLRGVENFYDTLLLNFHHRQHANNYLFLVGVSYTTHRKRCEG